MSLRRLFLQQAQAVSTDFIMEIKTDNTGTSNNDQFTIPTNTGTYLYDVTTSDGQTITGNTGDLTITFPSAGTYDINISGDFPWIYFNNGGDKSKLTDIKQWGEISWANFSSAFYGCNSLTSVTVTDDPNLSGVIVLGGMFRNCTSMTTIDVSNWDMSGQAYVSNMFNGCTSLTTLDVSTWDVSAFQFPQSMFQNCMSLANLDVTSWNTSSVKNLSFFFFDCDLFDNDLSGWDISTCTNFSNFMASATGLSTPNYDATLISWAAQSPSMNEVISFGGSQYTLGGAAEAARTTLTTTYNWTITDGGGI